MAVCYLTEPEGRPRPGQQVVGQVAAETEQGLLLEQEPSTVLWPLPPIRGVGWRGWGGSLASQSPPFSFPGVPIGHPSALRLPLGLESHSCSCPPPTPFSPVSPRLQWSLWLLSFSLWKNKVFSCQDPGPPWERFLAETATVKHKKFWLQEQNSVPAGRSRLPASGALRRRMGQGWARGLSIDQMISWDSTQLQDLIFQMATLRFRQHKDLDSLTAGAHLLWHPMCSGKLPLPSTRHGVNMNRCGGSLESAPTEPWCWEGCVHTCWPSCVTQWVYATVKHECVW